MDTRTDLLETITEDFANNTAGLITAEITRNFLTRATNSSLNKLSDPRGGVFAKDILSTPPVTPAEGDTYLVGTTPTGDWSGFTLDDVVAWDGTAWKARTPVNGEKAFVGEDPAAEYFYDVNADAGAGAWISYVPRGPALRGAVLPATLQSPAIISRSLPKWLKPEMFADDRVQLVYAPTAAESNDLSGATDFADPINAMTTYARTLLQDLPWPGLPRWKRHQFGFALEPGQNYMVGSGTNFTDFNTRGLVFEGNGASIWGAYQDGKAVVDMLGNAQWTVRNLCIRSSNDLRPSGALLIGSPNAATYGIAEGNHLDSVYIEGWWEKFTGYNYGSENFSAINCYLYSYWQAVPAWWIDCENTLDFGQYSSYVGDVTLADAGDNTSCINHVFLKCTIRSNVAATPPIDNPYGALRINSTTDGTNTNVRGVKVLSCYLTNKGPAVYIKGPVSDFVYDSHAEPNVGLTHIVYYDTAPAYNPVTQHGHKVRAFYAMATTSIIGKSAEGNNLNLSGMEIEVSEGLTPVIFGPNFTATNTRFSGKISTGSGLASGFINANLVYGEGEINTAQNINVVGMGGPSRWNVNDLGVNSRGYRKKSGVSVAVNGAITLNNVDQVVLTGAVITAISFSNGNRFHQFEVINQSSNYVTVSGLEGPDARLAPGSTASFEQYTTLFYCKSGDVNTTTVRAVSGFGPVADDLTALAAFTADDLPLGRFAGLHYGEAFGGYGDGDFVILSGNAAANGLTADGVAVVQNSAGDRTLVRKRFYDEGKLDCLWWSPERDGTSDSGTALAAAFTASRTHAPATGWLSLLIPAIGVPLVSGTELLLGSNVKLTGGGILKAHSTLPQNDNLVNMFDWTDGLGNYANDEIILDDVHFDGASRSFVAADRQSLVRLFSIRDLTVRNCSFQGQESHLLAPCGNKRTKILGCEFKNWGFDEPADGIDAGSAIAAFANPADGTINSELIINANTIHDGKWNAIQCFSDYYEITSNVLKDVQECGIFIKDLSATSAGNYARYGVVAQNIISGVTAAYIDASAIVLGAVKCICKGNVIENCDANGISVVSMAADVEVSHNIIINPNNDPVLAPTGAGIKVWDADATLTPGRIRLLFNEVRDEQGTPTAVYGIAFLDTGAGNAGPGFNDVQIIGNKLTGSSATAGNELYVEPNVLGSRFFVRDNPGAPKNKQTSGVIGASEGTVTLTGTGGGVSTETILGQVTIPGSFMKPNSRLEIEALENHTNSANLKQLRIRLGGIGGTIFYGINLTTTVSLNLHHVIANLNSRGAQISGPSGGSVSGSGYGTSTSAAVAGTVNTAADVVLVITGQLSAAADTALEVISLFNFTVKLIDVEA